MYSQLDYSTMYIIITSVTISIAVVISNIDSNNITKDQAGGVLLLCLAWPLALIGLAFFGGLAVIAHVLEETSYLLFKR